jgi:tRNA(fMet)-specific endonuclease VapC
VAAGLILETTFLIDLERELLRGDRGPAQQFLEAHAAAPLAITFTTAGELAAGTPLAEPERWRDFIAAFEVLPCTAEVCWTYGQTYRYLRANGILIGANDLWIGATAVAFRRPLVTRNARHFQRIPQLSVLGYG